MEFLSREVAAVSQVFECLEREFEAFCAGLGVGVGERQQAGDTEGDAGGEEVVAVEVGEGGEGALDPEARDDADVFFRAADAGFGEGVRGVGCEGGRGGGLGCLLGDVIAEDVEEDGTRA